MADTQNGWVIFDADNTLWPIEHLYDTARLRLCQYLCEMGIDLSVAERYQRQRDKELYETYGYSACRFARSFEDTMLHFVTNAPAEAVRHARGLALDVFEQRAVVVDDLEEVLKLLSSAYSLAIITAGERWVQERRLADFHLRQMFAAVEIVESKNESVFRSFATRHGPNPATSWVVGDSYRSDILPAKAAGFRAVLVDTENWREVEHLSGAVEPDAVIKKLRDLPAALGSGSL